MHLGASRIIAVSTRYRRKAAEVELRQDCYPPSAQILGKLFNAMFLDVIDQDAQRLQTRLICELPAEKRDGMREIGIVVIRPSVDLGKLAREHEPDLPEAFAS